MKKIKILLTFDYELPLGEANNYDRSLFQPANKLISLANDLNVPIVLFADVCSAIRFRDWDHEGYYLPFRGQLHHALRDGHDVQLHIHPHWMTSTFANGKFFPSLDYSLSSFKVEKAGFTIESIVEDAFYELTNIGKACLSDYRCITFRAGGYDVEPESKRILNKLHELGVFIESSVVRNLYLDYSYSHVDYSDTPALSQWLISKDGPLTRPSSSGLIELPISSRPVQLSDIIIRRMKKMTNNKVYQTRIYDSGGNGFYARQGKQSFKSKVRKIFNPLVLSFDKEYLDYKDLMSVINYNVNKYKSEKNDLVFTAIGHPKSMGSYHLDLMAKFVKEVRSCFDDRISFITYRNFRREDLDHA